MKNLIKNTSKAVLLGLCCTSVVLAQTSTTDDEDSDTEELGKVKVTGSRIAKTDFEGPAPVLTITADDIKREGFTTAFEVLASQPMFNGNNQDDQFSGGFTQAANSLDLRGLGPGRVLTLLNGRRMSEYPLPFNGQSNIVNLANIPTVMIQRIDILTSGASAIYGSDAVAGVINIILKDTVDELSMNLRLGDTADGGGESQRFQLAGGWSPGRLKLSYGFEYFNRDPIWAFQRDFQDSFADNPTNSGIPRIDDPINGVTNSRTFLILDPFDQDGDGSSYIDPGAAACDPLSGLSNGTVEYSFRSNRGFYCGTPNSVAQRTIRNAKDQYSFITNFTFDMDNNHELFGLVNYVNAETRFDTGVPFFQHDLDGPIGGGYFVNANSPDVFGIGGRVELWQRIFTHEEMGGYGSHDNIFDEESIDITIGSRGPLGDRFDYELSYTHSSYDTDRQRRLIVAQLAQDFYFGPVVGTVDFGFGEFDIFNADINRLYTPLTPAEFNQISEIDQTLADSSNQALQFVVTGDLFEMSAGYVGFAAVAEYGSQDYDIDIDPGLVDGRFFGFTGTGGAGERDRFALGVELDIPLHDELNLSVAGRYDKYDDITDVDDAFTYNVGLEWRPTRNLLVRGSAASSFRAPDMHFVFADPSGFFTTVTDEYLCRRDEPGVTFPNCTNSGVGISGDRQGNPDLEEEEGESFTAGFVWEIIDGMSVSVDYYDIELENVVRDLSIANLISTEADCRLGVTQGGQTVDPNSAECADALARITRLGVLPGNPQSEAITNVITGPINASLLKTNGIDANFNYAFDTEKLGLFFINASYNHVLESESQQFPGDPINNDRDDLQVFDFRSTARASVTWNYGDWTTTLLGLRTGSIPDWAETRRCCGNITYNGSLQYRINDAASVGLFVQNLRNSRPPQDDTLNAYPYYITGNFNPYGREYFLQFDYTFGR